MSYLRALYVTVPFCFLLGMWQGHKIESADLGSRSLNEIRILSVKDSIPHEILNQYEKRHPVVFVMEEVDTNKELLAKLKTSAANYDLVTVFNHQLSELPIVPIPLVNLFDKIDVRGDFLNKSDNSIPIQWGINGFLLKRENYKRRPSTLAEIFSQRKSLTLLPETEELYSVMVRLGAISPVDSIVEKSRSLHKLLSGMSQFVSFAQSVEKPNKKSSVIQMSSGHAAKYLASDKMWEYMIPNESATFWVRSLVIPETSQRQVASQRFIEYLFVPQVTRKMVEINWTASTNSKIEDLEVHPMLKPSWLRQVSLRQLGKPLGSSEQTNALGSIVKSIPTWQ